MTPTFRIISPSGYVRVFARLGSGEWFKWYAFVSEGRDPYPTANHVLAALAA